MDEFDPENFRIDPPPPSRAGGARPDMHARGGLWIPAQIMARLELNPISPVAWAVLCCLLHRKFKGRAKEGTVLLTKAALAKWKVPRRQKYPALDELAQHELLTYTRKDRRNPQVVLSKHLLR